MIVGAMHLNNNRTGIALPIIGIGTGIGQATLGAFNMRNYQYNSINHKRLAMINVGLGTLTTLFNTYVLVNSIKNRKPNSDLTWNVYGHQNPFNNQFAMGISINKQF